MENFFNSFGEWWRERRNSSLYFTFIFFVILWNWEAFYLLFIAEQVNPLISNFEYVILQNESITKFYVLDWIIYKCNELLIPAFLTFLSIRYLPRLNDWAQNIENSNFFNRRLLYDEKRADFEVKRTIYLKKIAEQKAQQQVFKVEIEERTTEKEDWQNEFADLINDKNSFFTSAMSKAIDAIYYQRGVFNQGDFGREFLDLLLGYKVIEVKMRDGIGERIEFTNKGEDFAKMFTSKSRMG